MATEIGSITALIGTATATSLDGTVRNLQVGDKVFQNDIITTGAAGAIEIEFNDGNVMDMGRDSQAVLDLAVFDPDAPVAETAVADDVFDDIEAIQQALLEGEDPTLIADPAAAGPQGEGSSEGGSSTVVRDYLNPSMTPQNGFDTTGPTISFLTPEPTQFLNLTGTETPEGDSPDLPIVPPPPGPPQNTETLTLLMSIGNEQIPTNNTNFIINGSFEDINGIDHRGNTVSGVESGNLTGTQFVQMQSITGWQLVDPNMPAMEPHAAGHGNVGSTDGNHYMDLGASPGNSAIFQQVSGLLDGQSYTLRFDYLDKALKMANSSDSGVMEVIWNGETIAVIEGENRNNWKSAEYSLLAGAGDGSNTLIFNEIGSIDNHGIAIDNVSLSPTTIINYYQYELSILASGMFETDGNPGVLKIDATYLLNNGVAIAGEVPVRNFPARTYEIEVENNQPTTFTLISENPISAEFINSIEGQISFVNSAGELVTANANAFVELTGTAANDALTGTDANELIYGGAGNDILTGGGGSDIFVWRAGDEGSAESPASDIVTDFNAADGDVLDFSDLLQGEESGDITDFISVIESGDDVLINLTPEGNGEMTQTIKLEGTSFNDLGIGGFNSSQQAEIIQTLISNGQINVDQS